MNELTLINNLSNLTMSSREIADLVEKRHDTVKLSIERLAEKGIIQLPPMVEVKDNQSLSANNTYKVYLLEKRDTYIVVAQLSPEFTARLVDRWQQLENNAKNPVANLSRIELLKLALDSEEKRIELEHKVSELKPKAEALDHIATYSEGSFCIRDAAKTLQVKEKLLIKFLIEKSWTYRRPMGSGYIAYSDKIKSGLLEHKVTSGERKDGTEWVSTQVRITAKGLAKLAETLINNPLVA